MKINIERSNPVVRLSFDELEVLQTICEFAANNIETILKTEDKETETIGKLKVIRSHAVAFADAAHDTIYRLNNE